MLHIILASDSWKGSLSAPEACRAMKHGVKRALRSTPHRFSFLPLADGGEGTVAALLQANGGTPRTTMVAGPLGNPVEARWAILPDGHAVIEMAQASGLTLIPVERRDALRASSAGTGELLQAALDAGCPEILLGIGGSATTDGGSGALRALGARFLDDAGHALEEGGAALQRLHHIDISSLDARLRETTLRVLCDVTNPLCGENGAARIYGPQKGASPEDVELLDAALQQFATVTAQLTGQDLQDHPGAGAAGGIGFGLLSFAGAQLQPGIEVVLEAAHFAEKLNTADMVLTGEGSLDAQTLSGKTIAGVTRAARSARAGAGIPVIAFGGAVKLNGQQMDQLGLLAALPVANGPLSLDQCIAHADELLADATERALRIWLRKNF